MTTRLTHLDGPLTHGEPYSARMKPWLRHRLTCHSLYITPTSDALNCACILRYIAIVSISCYAADT